MIIFGTKTRHSKVKNEETLINSCPYCQRNLELHDLKEWFTLYFIPIFPFNKIESFYKCINCKQTYKKEIKSMLAKSQR